MPGACYFFWGGLLADGDEIFNLDEDCIFPSSCGEREGGVFILLLSYHVSNISHGFLNLGEGCVFPASAVFFPAMDTVPPDGVTADFIRFQPPVYTPLRRVPPRGGDGEFMYEPRAHNPLFASPALPTSTALTGTRTPCPRDRSGDMPTGSQ